MATLLFIFIALPAVLMVSAMVCTWAASRLARDRELQRRHSRPPLMLELGPGKPFTVISLLDAFEPATAALWDTQIAVLEHIRTAGREGLDVEELRLVYQQQARRFPELYDGSSFAGWVRFLEHADLVVCYGASVAISAKGCEFLDCRISVTA